MKKNKILLIILVVGIITLGIVIFIKSQAVTETKRLGNGESTNHEENQSLSILCIDCTVIHTILDDPHCFDDLAPHQ